MAAELAPSQSTVKRLWNVSVERAQNADLEDVTLCAAFNAAKAEDLRKALWQHIYDADTFTRPEMVPQASGPARREAVEFEPTIRERSTALVELPSAKVFALVVGFYAEAMKRGHQLLELSAEKIARRTGLGKSTVDRAHRWLVHAGMLSSHERKGVAEIDGVTMAVNKSSLRSLTTKAVEQLRLGFVLRTAQANFERGQIAMVQALEGDVRIWQKDFTAERDPVQLPEDPVKLMRNAMDSVSDITAVMIMDGGKKRAADENDRVSYANRPRMKCPCLKDHKMLMAKMKEGDLEAARTLIRHHKEVREALTPEQLRTIMAGPPPAAEEVPY